MRTPTFVGGVLGDAGAQEILTVWKVGEQEVPAPRPRARVVVLAKSQGPLCGAVGAK